MDNRSLYERRPQLIKGEEISTNREEAYPSPPNYSPNLQQQQQQDNYYRRDSQEYRPQEPQYYHHHQQPQYHRDHYDHESRQFHHSHSHQQQYHPIQNQNQQYIIHQQPQRTEDIHSPYSFFSGTPPATPASPVHSYYYPQPSSSHYEASLNHEQYQQLQHHNQVQQEQHQQQLQQQEQELAEEQEEEKAPATIYNPTYQFPLPSDASSSTSSEHLNESLPVKVKPQPRTKSSQAKPMAFIVKLRQLLNGDNNDVLRWETSGKTFIVSHCNPRLTELLLSTFGHSNYTSFTRQLNVYLFNRVDSATLGSLLDLNSEAAKAEGLQINHFHGWKHVNFVRDDESKCIGMIPRLSPARKRALADKEKNGQKVRKNSKEAKVLALEKVEPKSSRKVRKGKQVAVIPEESESDDYNDEDENI